MTSARTALSPGSGYTPHNAHRILGIGRSTVFRIANGTSEVTTVIERLIHMYETYGIPKEYRE